MEDNKYLEILNNAPDSEERKMARKKKRTREKVIALAVLFIILVILFAGGVAIGKLIVDRIGAGRDVQTVSETSASTQEVKDKLDDLVGEEEDVVVITPSIEPEAPSAEELYDAWLTEKISALTLEEKVLGLFIVTPEGLTGVTNVYLAGDSTKASIEKYPVGGIIYGTSNIKSENQFKEMLANTKSYTKYETFLMINEESGNTILASKLNLEKTKTAAEIGDTMDPYNAYTENKVIADYLTDYGINFNIGLTGDTLPSSEDDEPVNSFISDRAFGTDPIIVSRMVHEAINAYSEDNMSVAVGCFPGQGALEKDPGTTVSNIEISTEEIETYQRPVYEAAVSNGATAIIVSHEYATGISSGTLPCSLSKEIYTDILRDEYGFTDTILITDSLSKDVISSYYTSAEACVKAIKAGADMVMCPENLEEGYKAVVEAVNSGVISEDRINDSLKRIWRVKYAKIYEDECNLSTGDNE